MPKIFVYLILVLISISFQRTFYTLQELNDKFKSFVNLHKSKDPLGFNLSDTTYLEILNISITYIPQITTYDMFYTQIDYYHMDVFFLFNLKLHNGRSRDGSYVKNITVQVDNMSGVINFDRFQFYRLSDNGFQYNKELTPVSYNISMKYINEYELYRELLNDEQTKNKIKEILLFRWNQLLSHMFSIFPQCDAFYYYNKMIENLIRRGEIEVHYPEYPEFTLLHFQSITYSDIQKINNYTEELIGVTVRVNYIIGGSIYNPKFYFNTIHVTKNEIIFGKFLPPNPVVEEVMTYYMKEAFKYVLKHDN